MKNKLTDLNDHLFAQLERLSDESISAKDLDKEVTRAAAIVEVAGQIVRGADLQLKAVALIAVHGERHRQNLSQLGVGQAQSLAIEGPR